MVGTQARPVADVQIGRGCRFTGLERDRQIVREVSEVAEGGADIPGFLGG